MSDIDHLAGMPYEVQSHGRVRKETNSLPDGPQSVKHRPLIETFNALAGLMGKKGRKLVAIVDPSLQGIGGHHFAAAERLEVEIRVAGAQCQILCSANADAIVIKSLSARRCFSETLYGRADLSVGEFRRRALAMSRELSGMFRWQRPDLLVLPTCDQVLMYALALSLEGMGRRWQPKVLAWFLFPPESANALAEYRSAGARLASALQSPDQVHAYCETRAAQAALQEFLPFQLERRPGPSAVPDRIVEASLALWREPRVPLIACMGHSNAGKGYGLLPDALALATAENEEALFNVHGFIDRRDKVQDRAPFEKLAALGPRVCFQGGVLPTGHYHALMVAADMLLLPYSPEVYRSRGSGIFNDGERLGKPAIAPRECSFASEAFAQGRAIPIECMSARAIADAVSIALRDFKSLQSRATAYARQHKTDGLGELIASLLQAEPECTSAATRLTCGS